MIAQDNNLITYEYYKDQFVPKEVYTSGEKDETKLIDKYSFNNKELPVLILKDDIISKDGRGLRKGFYNVLPDKYMDFLLIYQKGELKAKIPVIKMEFYESLNTEQQKPKKMSYKKYQRYMEKEQRKYFRGLNPDEIDYKNVQIHYIEEENAAVIIYNTNNIELTGMIKL